MKKILLFTFMLSVSLSSFAQKKKGIKKQTSKRTTTASSIKPRQIPGTENQKTHAEAKLNSALPNFRLADQNRKLITEQDIPKNNSVIFAMFSPSCDHCIDAMKVIKDNMNQLQNTTVYFITFTSNLGELNTFIATTGIASYANIHVCVAEEKFILGHFMPNYIAPQVMFYNKQHKLKKIQYETIDIATGIAALNQL